MAVAAPTSVKFLGLSELWQEHEDEYREALLSVYPSGQLVRASRCAAVEERLAELTQRQHCVAASTCSDALVIALTAAGVGAGDEVIVPAYSWISSASCILRVGAKPVFVDIDREGLLDLKKVDGSVTRSTKAMIYVSLYGLCGDFETIVSLAEAHDLILIEDAAQSLGSTFSGAEPRPSGKLGDLACLSFAPTKPFPCFGNGGAVLTDDAELAKRARLFVHHGKPNNATPTVGLGGNYLMHEDKAALLGVTLNYFDEIISGRQRVAASYLEKLADAEVGLPDAARVPTSNWHKFVVTSPRRDELMAELQARGIQTQVHYRVPMYREPIFDCDQSFEMADWHAAQSLTLPLYPEMSSAQIDAVCDVVKSFVPRAAAAG